MAARGLRIALWAAAATAGATILAAAALGQGLRRGAFDRALRDDRPRHRGVDRERLDDADDDGVALAIIRIDTPGGLDTSTREMVQAITGSPCRSSPTSRRTGPRRLGGGVHHRGERRGRDGAPDQHRLRDPDLDRPGRRQRGAREKIENDAAAYARALAEGHGRNGELAARTVTEAENVTAEEALAENLIDLVVGSEQELLERLDGFQVQGRRARPSTPPACAWSARRCRCDTSFCS